ncbi:uncharacterized protein LOC129000583 [Macrosteles quadrilineatus]|uniref:uncharacterized protein LOC129000583 n=1 Tax=Macrosteles quadrilineatus TaxID=74068 RepID=UPI0023E2F3A0|nr:uncharacterized protein LOC129000583 [Macrosteles quadrilineatus]
MGAKKVEKVKDKAEELVFLELEQPSTKCPEGLNEDSDFYPCFANHSGITIRITGADSIESVDSESTDNEVQIEENFMSSLYNIVEFRPDNKTFVSKTYQKSRVKETTYQLSNETFILKGTKSTQNVRSPKSTQKDAGPYQRNYKKEESKRELAGTKPKPEKTDHTVPHRAQKETKVAVKPKQLSFKSKLEEDSDKTEECCVIRKARPKSCVEKESVKVKTSSRPLTAPVKRSCCQWGQPHLPEYNGLRSEYGLSAEQLMERKRHKIESLKMQKQRKEQKYKEEQEKRKENEAKFIAWLEDKRKQAQMQFLRNQKIKAESGIKLYPAPTAHLKRTGAIRSRRVFKTQRKCVSLEELLNNASRPSSTVSVIVHEGEVGGVRLCTRHQ